MRLTPLHFLVVLAFMVAPLHAQIQYAPTSAGPFLPLDGATVKGSIHVRLQQTTGTPWIFTLDGATKNTEAACPCVLANESGSQNDNNLWNTATSVDGAHVVTAKNATQTLTATFTIANASAPAPPAPQSGTQITWTLPTENADGSALTDLAGIRVYTGTTQVAQLGLVTSWKPTASGTYYLTAFTTAGAESLPSQFVVFVLATPVDPCVADPLTLVVKGWPGANTGSRLLSYATNKPITALSLVWPLKVTVTGVNGCTASVLR